MRTRFSIDTASGAISRFNLGAPVPPALVNILYARDIVDLEVVFTANGEDKTTEVLGDGITMRIGLRANTSEGVILAQSNTYVLDGGVARTTFSLNTSEMVAFLEGIPADARPAKVYFEVELAAEDDSWRYTVAQQQFALRYEVNMEGDEPPAAAEESATTATAQAIIATTQAGIASTKAGEAAASAAAAAAYQAKIEVASVAALAAISVTSFAVGDVAAVRDFSTTDDGGFGFFELRSTSVTPVPGMIVASPTAGKQWHRKYSGHLDVRWFGAKGDDATDDTSAVRSAIAFASALGGGTVYFPSGRYYVRGLNFNSNYIADPGVTLRGEKMPCLSPNADRLQHGAIIAGRLNVFADDFAVENLGFDMGKYTMDTHFPGYDSLSSNNPDGYGWDAFAFAQPNMGSPLAMRKNFRAQNVIGLLSRPGSYGHAVLMEGFDGGFVDNVIGVYGVHGVVIKASNVRGGSVAGWMASTDCVIFKSDTYAGGGHINLASVEARTVAPNTAPWTTPAPASYGLLINPATASFAGPVSIGTLKAFGSTVGLGITGGASLVVADVSIGQAVLDGYTGTMTSGIDFNTCRCIRAAIGSLIVNGAAQGVSWAPATLGDNIYQQLKVGTCYITNMTVRALNAALYGRIRIDTLEITACINAYRIESNGRIIVGSETLVNVTTKWEINPPVLNANWSNLGGGNSTFDVMLKDYGVAIKGLIGAGATPSATICTLPDYLRPTEAKRFPSYLNDGARKYAMINVDPISSVLLNDNTAPATGNYVSLDGIQWKNW